MKAGLSKVGNRWQRLNNGLLGMSSSGLPVKKILVAEGLPLPFLELTYD